VAATNINRVIITGNLTRDPELRSTASGTSVCSLRVACNTRRKDQSTGDWVDKPNFFDVTVWGAQGENCARFLAKGRPVAIDGRLEWREWDTPEGHKRDSEVGPPQRGVTIENNIVEDNSAIDAPGQGAAGLFYGVGIGLAGGQGNHVIGNTVKNHKFGGIIISLITFPPETLLYLPAGNTVWGNTVSGSGMADIAQGALSGPGNCYNNNTYETTAPVALELIWSCTNFDDNGDPKLPYYPTSTPPGGDPRVEEGFAEAASNEVTRATLGQNGLNGRNPSDWRTWPAPTCANSPNSCINMPDENGDSSYVNDGAVDLWLPGLL
jgi:single-strand DNA-binding protein